MTKKGLFIKNCAQYIGVPYIWGGSNPAIGLDCSGYAQLVLEPYRLDPKGDQTADGLMNYFSSTNKGLEINLGRQQLGDLLFFGNDDKATHIAIYAFEGLMFEAGGGGHLCKTVAYAKSIGAQVRLADMNRRQDLLKILRPIGLSFE